LLIVMLDGGALLCCPDHSTSNPKSAPRKGHPTTRLWLRTALSPAVF
jgi:hypothetical protein